MNLEKKYEILETLSESEKSVVFSARSKKNGGRVVVRVIYNAAAGVLKALPQIRNPHTAQVLEVIQDQSDVIVIEKFIEGVTLRQLLDEGEKLTETEIHTLFTHLCKALSAIHREGIIHRDLKPSNIIIHNKTAVLIDFDVARRHDPRQSADTVNMGTKGYAAPEQYGFSQTDSRSDIYSLGVVMKELLGGRLNTAACKNVIEKCTQFDPENRYQTAEKVLEHLGRIATEAPVIPPASQTSPKHPNIRTAFKIISCIFVCVFLVSAVYILSSGNKSENEKAASSAASSMASADERTLETFTKAYKELGVVLKDEGVPFYKLIGAKNGIIFYMSGQKVAIYEFETEKALKGKALISKWPANGRFVLESSNEEAITIFNSVAE